jgi:hypothetical protein
MIFLRSTVLGIDSVQDLAQSLMSDLLKEFAGEALAGGTFLENGRYVHEPPIHR